MCTTGEAYIALQHRTKAIAKLTEVLQNWQNQAFAEAVQMDEREWNASLDRNLRVCLHWLEQELGFAGEV